MDVGLLHFFSLEISKYIV